MCSVVCFPRYLLGFLSVCYVFRYFRNAFPLFYPLFFLTSNLVFFFFLIFRFFFFLSRLALVWCKWKSLIKIWKLRKWYENVIHLSCISTMNLKNGTNRARRKKNGKDDSNWNRETMVKQCLMKYYIFLLEWTNQLLHCCFYYFLMNST